MTHHWLRRNWRVRAHAMITSIRTMVDQTSLILIQIQIQIQVQVQIHCNALVEEKPHKLEGECSCNYNINPHLGWPNITKTMTEKTLTVLLILLHKSLRTNWQIKMWNKAKCWISIESINLFGSTWEDTWSCVSFLVIIFHLQRLPYTNLSYQVWSARSWALFLLIIYHQQRLPYTY